MKICRYCFKGVADDVSKCPRCGGSAVPDQKALLKIVEDFKEYILAREDPQQIGMLLGIPESYLPYTKETIEEALEFFMLVYALEFLRTGSSEAEMKFNVYALNYLALAEYFPDEEMLFYDLVVSQEEAQQKCDQLSAKLKDENNIRDFQSWAQRMYANEARYHDRVKQIKAKAQALYEKMSDVPEESGR